MVRANLGLTVEAPAYILLIFTDLKLWIAVARLNVTVSKITDSVVNLRCTVFLNFTQNT